MNGGRKTKKIDNYDRAGCRGRLFSPSSLCGRKTRVGRIGRELELNPAHITRQPDTMNLIVSFYVDDRWPNGILNVCHMVQSGKKEFDLQMEYLL